MKYYVNKNAQPTGEHEVHTVNCSWLPEEQNRQYLGDFKTCGPAVTSAKAYFTNVDGCYYCSNDCHTR